MRHSFLAGLACAALAACGLGPATTATAPAPPAPKFPTAPASPTQARKRQTWRYDDPRCTDDERKAIRAAANAVTDPTKSPPDFARDFYFNMIQTPDGWEVTVWDLPPGTMAAPGGFEAVDLNPDFTLRRIVGGA